MTVGSTSPVAGSFQGFGVGNDRQSDRPSAVIARQEKQEKAEPSRREDETTRPAAVETQSTKRGADKNRGTKMDFVV
jgi:hypothetical protein